MKHKFNYLKSTASALALSLALLEGITPPDFATEGFTNFPLQPGIEKENPNSEYGDGDEILPLSDRDEKEKMLDE